jgi:tRNA-2-methylthio-N6-dimethylallyladenosine synthase
MSEESESGEKADLATLLEYLSEIDGLERIRYMTPHPREMSRA